MRCRLWVVWGLFVVTCVLLAGCVSQPSPVHYGGRFTTRPVRVVLAPMLAECLPEAQTAQRVFTQLDVSMTVEQGDVSDLAYTLRQAGTIVVERGLLNDGERGRTMRVPTLLGDIRSAVVVLAPGECRPEVLMHELGHALGLKDTWTTGNMMCGSVDCAQAGEGSYTWTQEQVDWIRDP